MSYYKPFAIVLFAIPIPWLMREFYGVALDESIYIVVSFIGLYVLHQYSSVIAFCNPSAPNGLIVLFIKRVI